MWKFVNVALTAGCIGVVMSGTSVAQPPTSPPSEHVRTETKIPLCQGPITDTTPCTQLPGSAQQRCRQSFHRCAWFRGKNSGWECQKPIYNWKFRSGLRLYFSDVCWTFVKQ